MTNQDQQIVAPSSTGEISGLPQSLPPGTLAILLQGGKVLALAMGERLTTYQLLLQSYRPGVRELARQRLPGHACAIAESALGLLIATEQSGRSALLLLRESEIVTILELPGKITALAAAGAQAYLVILEEDGRRGRLAQINLRQRAVVAERPLDHAQMKLSVDPTGQHVVLVNPVERKVVSLGSDLKPRSADPARPQPETNPSTPPERSPHDPCCCCVLCKPIGEGEPASPQTPPGREPPRQPAGPGPEHNGDVAVPSGNGGTVVGNGDRVDHYPPTGTGRPPCGRSLFYTVAELQRLGAYVLASDRTARRVALLSADMNLLEEWQFGRGGAMLLPAEGTAMFVMHFRDSGKWVWRDVHEMVSQRRPYLDLFPFIPLESKTFIGQQTYALSHGQQPAPTSVKALMLPVIEGDQSFSSADLSGFGAYMNRTMLPLVKDYYDENSFGILKDVSVSVFGVHVGPIGGPLKLPRAKLADYYFPAYDPAKVELVKKGVNAASQILVDGRESLTIEAKPLTGGPKGGTLTFPFFALAFQRDDDLFPFQVKFLGTETLTLTVKTPAGAAKTLDLTFPAKVIDIADLSGVAAKLNELASYLDGVMNAAEMAAGISPRLFAPPKTFRIAQIGKQFGRLLVTFNAANTTGNKLSITGATSTHPGGDPMGLADPILGTMTAGDTTALGQYLENAALLAQEAAGFGYNARLLNDPACAFDAGATRLTTTVAISDRNGGPGAEVKFTASSGLETLFDTAASKPNSATTKNDAQALRDRTDLYRDAFSAALERLREAGQPTNALQDFGCVLIMPVEPATPDPTNPSAVLPSEVWNVSPLYRPFDFRGAENITTVIDRKDEKIQLQSAWALIFMTGGIPDNALICHELGHALGYGDLYHQTGYRDELAYMGSWAMMDWHPPLSHHCGYHKLQSGWIPDGAGTESDFGRVYPLGLPDPSVTRTWDLLLVPIELWRDSLLASSRAAFGVGNNVPVVQLGWIDFGGDGATFGLIEARQPGARFSKNLPGGGTGGVLITNGIIWTLDERFATNTWYRRPLQLLNPDNILRNAGDQFDLAHAPELPVKGMKVEVVDRKLVEGDAQVYRVKVSRENAEFVDLYFTSPDIYYKNPDLWLDWAGNNAPNPETLNPDFQIGEPTDQGEAIRVHPSHPEQHWMVARLRNRGQVKALDVKLNFFYYEPPGGGDGGNPMDAANLSHYKLIGSTTFPEIPGKNDPRKILLRWDVPPGFSGHTCLLVQIEDYKIPEDSTGAALGSDDVWQVNNHAQKNVDKYEALSGSPFAPIEFDFSVHNAGVAPELAYPEPDGLPYGMKLTVTPPQQTIASGQTVLFHCKLELDEQIIRTGCENDQRFRIHAWRQDPESSARWGGVEYEIRPREKTETQLGGTWDFKNEVTLNGTIVPDPGGGTVHIRLDFQNQQARWAAVAAAPGGKFTWTGHAPASSFVLEAVAWFEGNRKFGSSRSNTAKVTPPPVIR